MEKIFLSVVIPAFNEEKRIVTTLAAVEEFLAKQKYSAEVIVVDDGSTDKTSGVVTAFWRDKKYRKLISNKTNSGKGFAVKTGMLAAIGEYVLFMDADSSTPIDQLDKLLAKTPKYEVVIGSRYLNKATVKIKQPLYRIWLSRLGNFLIQLLLIPDIYDTQCGFKLFSRSAAQEIFSLQRINRWSFDMEVLALARKLGYAVREVAVDWYHVGDSRIRPVKAYPKTFLELLRIKWNFLTRKYD